MFSMGRFSTTILSILAASPYLSVAAPVRRTLSATDPNVVVLQFASVLEQLETSFYAQALSKFQASDFTSAGFTSAQVVIEQITAISTDEATHTTVLQQELVTLGQTPLQCQFDFASALTDVSTTLTVARLVENVGVGAYLGAAHLLTDPTILTAAASIVTIEARHQTILNMFNSGNAIPNAFDLPLQPNEVLALAGSFVSGCDLGIAANTALTITTTQITIGASLAFSWSGMPSDLSSSGMFCQIMAGGMPVSIAQPISQCTVPDKTAGPLAVWITSDNQPLNNNARDRTNSTTVAGPSIIFVDVVEEQISALVRTPSGSSSPSSSSSAPSESSPSEQSLSETVIPTSTIPVAEATSLLASATGNPMVYMIPAPAANA